MNDNDVIIDDFTIKDITNEIMTIACRIGEKLISTSDKQFIEDSYMYLFSAKIIIDRIFINMNDRLNEKGELE